MGKERACGTGQGQCRKLRRLGRQGQRRQGSGQRSLFLHSKSQRRKIRKEQDSGAVLMARARMNKPVFAAAILLLLPCAVFAAGGEPFAFLKLGAGTRAMGMGG